MNPGMAIGKATSKTSPPPGSISEPKAVISKEQGLDL
jgi:hypothetical protein